MSGLLMSHKLGGGSCNFQPCFRGWSVIFVPKGGVGSCVFYQPPPPHTFCPLPKTNEIWRQNSEIHSALACSGWPPWFPDLSTPYGLCVKRGSGKHMFGLSLVCPSRQSNISTSGEERFKYPLPWENKISQMPYPRANKDNQIPTPCPASPRRHDIDRCIIKPNLLFAVVVAKLKLSLWGRGLHLIEAGNDLFS